MRLGSKSNNSSKKHGIGKVRKSQLITTFGSGSIVDMVDYSVIIAATDEWTVPKEAKLYEPNLQKVLGMKYFVVPPSSPSTAPMGGPDIPAYRFPQTLFCSHCHTLQSYKTFGDNHVKKCPKCGNNLIPSRFVAACANGHLEDFPYKWWVHHGNIHSCTHPDKFDNLEIHFSSESGGLDSITIVCGYCGAKRTMAGCMSPDALKGYHCRGKRPWIGLNKSCDDPEECHAIMRTLQRDTSNLYFSKTISALTIPPLTQKLRSVINEIWTEINDYISQGVKEPYYSQYLSSKQEFKELIESHHFTIEDIKKAIEEQKEQIEDSDYTYTKLIEDEYKALSTPYEGEPDEQFKTISANIPEKFREYLDEVMLVTRLREVMALRGFRRITPEKPDDSEETIKQFGKTSGSDFTPLSQNPLDWLPAVELLGEGIFIKLNNKRVEEWEEKNGTRYESMKANLQGEKIAEGKFSPRYVLLHTLSHLLIRQLTMECGYSGAAIKERIYSTMEDHSIDMAGILIYTASSDSDGSLGGLVRQGKAEMLNNTLLNMIQDATWCSSDPLCIESMNQGYKSLNYAACHACALLPETSCEARNCLLDRVAVVGKMEDRSMGYFGKLLEE
jgi:hypothetical protein